MENFILLILFFVSYSITGLLRIWLYIDAKQIEDGKQSLNLFEALIKCMFSIDFFLWFIPLRKEFKNKHSKKMYNTSTFVLFINYGFLVATIIIISQLP
jgi:hypothetical protein